VCMQRTCHQQQVCVCEGEGVRVCVCERESVCMRHAHNQQQVREREGVCVRVYETCSSSAASMCV